MDYPENREIVGCTAVEQPIRLRAIEKVFNHLRQRSVEQPYSASSTSIGREIGLSRRTVIYAVNTLKHQNRISCQKSIEGLPNTYQILCTSEMDGDTLPGTETTSPTYNLIPPPHSDIKEQIAEMYRRLSPQEFDDLLETMGETALQTAVNRLAAAAGGVDAESAFGFFVQVLKNQVMEELITRLARW